MIDAQGLTKDYGDKRAVDGLTFTVHPGVVTGFLGPNGSGKSTTMRLILGLDAPTAGDVTVNGKHYRDHPAPLHEVGALLEARSVHTGRSAYNHLLALAQTHGIPKSRVDELIDLVGLHEVARKRAGQFSLGMGQRLGIATALLGDPQTVMLDEPVNGLDPEGIHWIRNLLKGLAAEGRTVFVSSHLMSEMALTADHLIVIGRGRLIADTSVDDFVRQASGNVVRVRSPQATRLAELLAGPDVTITSVDGHGLLEVQGLSAEQIGDARSRQRHRAPRADAAAGVARGRVHGADPRRRRVQGGRARGGAHERRDASERRAAVTQARVALSEWTKLRSLRSTRWSLLAAVVFTIGIAALACAVVANHYPRMDPREQANFDPLDVSLAGVHLAQLAIGVLGVLVITGEYSTGMIRASMTAVPKRLPVLWAKAASSRSSLLALMLPASLIAFFVGQAILSRHHIDISFSHPGVARAVIGAALYLIVVGLFALGLGAIVRNTAGGIALFAGIMFVIPPLMNVLPASWNNAISPYLPLAAGEAIMSICLREPSLAVGRPRPVPRLRGGGDRDRRRAAAAPRHLEREPGLEAGRLGSCAPRPAV